MEDNIDERCLEVDIRMSGQVYLYFLGMIGELYSPNSAQLFQLLQAFIFAILFCRPTMLAKDIAYTLIFFVDFLDFTSGSRNTILAVDMLMVDQFYSFQ